MPAYVDDVIRGSKNNNVAPLVERHSRFVMLVKVANKDTESVITTLKISAQKFLREWSCRVLVPVSFEQCLL